MEKKYTIKTDVTVTQKYVRTEEEKVSLEEYVASRVKYHRVLLGLTQEDLSNRLDISRQSVNNIENGRHGITLNMLGKVCEYFEVKSTDILPF